VSYGHPGCKSGVDEQVIVDIYLTLRLPVHHIHQKFNWIVGKYSWLRPGDEPKSLHYQGCQKPWTVGRDQVEWNDLKVWWKYADDAVAHDKESAKWFIAPQKSYKKETITT